MGRVKDIETHITTLLIKLSELETTLGNASTDAAKIAKKEKISIKEVFEHIENKIKLTRDSLYLNRKILAELTSNDRHNY